MHLKTIKLRGFKSFVGHPIEVRLEPGVAVVVGPNGSGKSNISDSILWASGSLSPHELRAEKPDDVLFAGSVGRKPTEFCEVELIFDNEDEAWPGLDYSEVSLARRLHRGGEGQYLINRTPVRRLDLVELLSDVGLGGGLRSVISQGSVESVLGAKPSERRSLVEEAAGLGRFKMRRHRAELKLTRVALQVERARDIEAEVKKRLRPLALQATAAERAEKLRGEIASLQAAIAALDLSQLADRRREADARRAQAAISRKALEAQLEALLVNRSSVEEELTDAAGAREGATAALYRLRADSERLELRRETLGALAAQFAEELATRSTPSESGELELAAREASAAAQAVGAEHARAELAAEERWACVAAWERAAEAEQTRQLDALLQGRHRLEQDLTGGGRDLLLAAARRRAAPRRSPRDGAAALRRRPARARPGAAAAAGASPAELGRAADEADEAARTKARERDDLRARAAMARDRVAALEQSLAEREGLAPACASARRGRRAAGVVAPRCSRRRREGGCGRTWAPRVGARRRRRRTRTAADRPGAWCRPRPADRPRRSPSPRCRRSRAGCRCGRFARLEDPGGHGRRDRLDPDRGELWFAGETAEAVLLELDARRRELLVESDEIEAAAARAEGEADDAATAAQAAAAAFAPVAHLRNVQLGDATLLDRIARAAGRLDETLRVAAAAARRLEDPVAARAATAAEELRSVASQEAELRRVLSATAAQAAAAERRANGRTGAAADVRTEAEALSAQVTEAAGIAAAAAQRAAAASRALAQAEGAAARRLSPLALERLANCAARAQNLLGVNVSAFEVPLRARVEADVTRTAELGSRLRELGAAEVGLRQQTSEAAEQLSAIDIELARADAERDEAQRRLDAAGEVEPAEGEDRGELAARLERLERRREQLGQVNPLAKEEYEAEKERLDELACSAPTWKRASRSSSSFAAELTETVERRFEETFAAVEHHFHEVAATLFPRRRRAPAPDRARGGGRGARHRGRATACGQARHAPVAALGWREGPRRDRLSLQPVPRAAEPVLLLDEVEAALDDTNIGRFTSLLRRYAGEAQFIVITHQKRTMEAADVLYGVTMGPDGVSQIVSRRLPQETEAAATA